MITLWNVVFGNNKFGRKGVIQKDIDLITSKFTGEGKYSYASIHLSYDYTIKYTLKHCLGFLKYCEGN